MTIETPHTPELAQISSYSQLILDLSEGALAALRAAAPRLEALSRAAHALHEQASAGEAGDVLSLLLAQGRAEEALAPLVDLPVLAAAGLVELREALHLADAPAPL